jgi:hypothetical protein
MSDTVIVRRRVESNFTTLSNELIRDDRLSWKALGLLVYLLSLPGNFKLRLAYLAKQRPSGRDATRSGLRELEVAGYLAIERSHDSKGRFSTTTWFVSSTPFYSSESPCSENPKAVEPKVASPEMEKPTLINTYTEQIQKEKSTTTTHDAAVLPRPFGLSDEAWLAIRNALVAVPPDDARALVDELTCAMSSGVIQKSPLQWFFGVKKRYEKGGFVPTSKPNKRPSVQKHRSVEALPRNGVSSEVGAQQLKKMKDSLTGVHTPTGQPS